MIALPAYKPTGAKFTTLSNFEFDSTPKTPKTLKRSSSTRFWKAEQSTMGLLRRSKSLPQAEVLTKPVVPTKTPRLYIAHLLSPKHYPKYISREISVEDLSFTLLPAAEIEEYPSSRRFRNRQSRSSCSSSSGFQSASITAPGSPNSSCGATCSPSSASLSSGTRFLKTPEPPSDLVRNFNPSTTWNRLREVLQHVSRRKTPVKDTFSERRRNTVPARRGDVEPEFIGTG